MKTVYDKGGIEVCVDCEDYRNAGALKELVVEFICYKLSVDLKNVIKGADEAQ